jgi:GT2 family glycosyltransferase
MIRADLVTVYHNETSRELHSQLLATIRAHEPDGGYRIIGIDNRRVNRGFARACNLGAFHPEATAPVIGFLNPDIVVEGPFLDQAADALQAPTVITGCRFDKPESELRDWGVTNWVCGAAMFVDRRWFRSVGGFDTQFIWSWEETDLIRQAEAEGLLCRSLDLPIRHEQHPDEPRDARYEQQNFDTGERLYRRKWRAG